MTSVFLGLVSYIPFHVHDMILGIVFGALLMGTGLALILSRMDLPAAQLF